MPKPTFVLLLLAASVGCAETQSQRAFVPRQPSEVIEAVLVPNRSPDHDRNLAESLDRSLEEQENEPMFPGQQGVMAEKASATPPVGAGDSRASKTAVPEP